MFGRRRNDRDVHGSNASNRRLTRCPSCGHLVDNRDLEEVFDHLDPHRVFPWRVAVRRVWRLARRLSGKR